MLTHRKSTAGKWGNVILCQGNKVTKLINLKPMKYRIVKRKVTDLKGGEAVEKAYAQPVYGELLPFDKVCAMIGERSTASSGDVKLVLDGLTKVLVDEMQRGTIIQLGELGNFRFSISSQGAATEEDFSVPVNVRGVRAIFTPGKALKLSGKQVKFESVKPIVIEKECDRPHVE